MKAAALRGALSDRARGGRVHVVSGVVEGDAPSTKTAVGHLRRMVAGRHVLLVAERHDELTWKSLRNAVDVHLIAPGQLNTYDVLVSDDVVFTEGALAEFVAGPAKGKPAEAVARSSELEDLADAVSTLAPGATDTTDSGAPKATSKRPATGKGKTAPAGEGVSDEEVAREVDAQTSKDLKAEPAFEAEAEGASSDTEAAKAPDEVGE
jgi:large subunit ribosomal protein L4